MLIHDHERGPGDSCELLQPAPNSGRSSLIHGHAIIVEAGMCWLECCKNPAVDILVLDPASLGEMRKLRCPSVYVREFHSAFALLPCLQAQRMIFANLLPEPQSVEKLRSHNCWRGYASLQEERCRDALQRFAINVHVVRDLCSVVRERGKGPA